MASALETPSRFFPNPPFPTMRFLALILAVVVLTLDVVAATPAEAAPDMQANIDALIAVEMELSELLHDAPEALSIDVGALAPRDEGARLSVAVDRISEEVATARSTANEILRDSYESASGERIEAAARELATTETVAMVSGLLVEAQNQDDPAASIEVLELWIQVNQMASELEAMTAEVEARLVLPDPTHYCPVDGSMRFEDTWWAPRPGGRRHRGTDVTAAYGTPLVAVEDGVVRQANWHRAGGYQLFLSADSGAEYFYAHLADYADGIQPGVRVEAGQLVGFVGTSGNADVAHLHFGMVPDGRSYPRGLVNPYPLLAGLCR